MSNPLLSLGQKAREAAALLAEATSDKKNVALQAMIDGLKASKTRILKANAKDLSLAEKGGMDPALLDRLKLDEKALEAITESLSTIKALPDPVDRLIESVKRPNGLRIEKRAIPIGVIGIIFEARPNVAVDAAALCVKSGNAVILRGGSDSWYSVEVLLNIIQNALISVGLPAECVQGLPSVDRDLVGSLLTLDQYVDVIIPRGGKSLIARVRAESRIPVFSHLDGICHTYIDSLADKAKAVAIAVNAKMRRTSVCGATECLLLNEKIVLTIGKDIIQALLKADCEVRVPEELLSIDPRLKRVCESDYGHEFLAPVIAVAIVANVKEAATFVYHHGSKHTDAIVTEDAKTADYFMRHSGSAIALHNASTQFADGGEFGKGAEIGIATGKLHARGPVGLEELTTYQYRIYGTGQIRSV